MSPAQPDNKALIFPNMFVETHLLEAAEPVAKRCKAPIFKKMLCIIRPICWNPFVGGCHARTCKQYFQLQTLRKLSSFSESNVDVLMIALFSCRCQPLQKFPARQLACLHACQFLGMVNTNTCHCGHFSSWHQEDTEKVIEAAPKAVDAKARVFFFAEIGIPSFGITIFQNLVVSKFWHYNIQKLGISKFWHYNIPKLGLSKFWHYNIPKLGLSKFWHCNIQKLGLSKFWHCNIPKLGLSKFWHYNIPKLFFPSFGIIIQNSAFPSFGITIFPNWAFPSFGIAIFQTSYVFASGQATSTPARMEYDQGHELP